MSESEMKIRSITPWFGGKRTMAIRIARECCRPDGRAPKAFWELCCGSMAVSLAMPRCSHHNVVDLHGDLMNLAAVIQSPSLGPKFYRQLRRFIAHEGVLIEAKAAIEADDRVGASAMRLFESAPDKPLSGFDRAVSYFILSWLGRNGAAGTKRINYQMATRWTSGGGHGGIRLASAIDSIPAWRRGMRNWIILQRDIFVVLPKLDDDEETSIYVDPPYLRDGIARSGSCTYLHEFVGDHHDRLFAHLSRFKKTRVVVSYYDHPALRKMYAGWTFVDCMTNKNLHVQNSRGAARCAAPEILIINGPSYAGAEVA